MTDTSMDVERVDTGFGKLAYRRMGSGPIAVLWHSLFVDGHSWDGITASLSLDRTLIVVDGPGCGASDPLLRRTPFNMPADAAAALIDSITDSPVDWVGNAWGGHVGLEVAAAHPAKVKSLIAISAPLAPTAADKQKQVRALLPIVRFLGPIAPIRAAIRGALLTEQSQTTPVIADNVDDAARRFSRGSLANVLQSFMLDRTDNSSTLPRVHCPTLLVASDDWDEWTPAKMAAAAELMPEARTAVIAGARALAPLEQPEAVTRLVRDFWSAQ